MSDTFTELKSYLDRIMRLHEERKGLSDDIGEIYKEARGRGFDRKAMVATVRRLLGDETAFAELDATVDLYLRAYRGTGTEHANAHVSAPALTVTPHNPDTGEIIEQNATAHESCGGVDGHAEMSTPIRSEADNASLVVEGAQGHDAAIVGIEPGPQDAKPLPAQQHRAIGGAPLKPAVDRDDLDAVTRARQSAMPDIPDRVRRAPVAGNA